jgi:hypothetical protein
MAESSDLPHHGGVVAFAKLFQGPAVEMRMPSYCSCNPTCACEEKQGCCEGKCSCHTDEGIISFPGWEVLSATAAFREAVATFNPEDMKTIAEFQALAGRISDRLMIARKGG